MTDERKHVLLGLSDDIKVTWCSYFVGGRLGWDLAFGQRMIHSPLAIYWPLAAWKHLQSPLIQVFSLICLLSVFSLVSLKLCWIDVVTENSITNFLDFLPAVKVTENNKRIALTHLLSSEMNLVVCGSLWCTTLLSGTCFRPCSLCTLTAAPLPLPSPRNPAGSYSKYSQLFIAGGYSEEMFNGKNWKNAYAHELAYHAVT